MDRTTFVPLAEHADKNNKKIGADKRLFQAVVFVLSDHDANDDEMALPSSNNDDESPPCDSDTEDLNNNKQNPATQHQQQKASTGNGNLPSEMDEDGGSLMTCDVKSNSTDKRQKLLEVIHNRTLRNA